MRYTVMRAPLDREYGAEIDVSKFVPGKNINLDEGQASRWVRRGVLVAFTDAKGGGPDDAGSEPPSE